MRSAAAFVFAVALALGCSHTQHVESSAGGKSAAADRGSHATPPQDASARPVRPPSPNARPPSDEPAPTIPLATSPSGLLKPGAEKKIQEKLSDKGVLDDKSPSGELDGPTREALRRFQHDQGLPATGMPDDATVKRLGLDPGDIFKAGQPVPGDKR
jgi:hypothetical protein